MAVLIRTKDLNPLKYSEVMSQHPPEYWKYYIRKNCAQGGVSGVNGCVPGCWSNGTRYNWFALPNCVGYAHGRALEMWTAAGADTSIISKLTCNAEDFIYRAYSNGYRNIKTPYKMTSFTEQMNNYQRDSSGNLIKDTSCVPKVGAICVFAKGKLGGVSPAGHVTVCEQVTGTYTGVFSESGWKYSFNNIFSSKEYNPLTYKGSEEVDYRNRLNPSLGGYYFVGYIYPPGSVDAEMMNAELLGDDEDVYTIQNKLWLA